MELVAAWPPMASRSTTSVDSPSEPPYTAAASPAGPAPMIVRSNWPSATVRGNPNSTARVSRLGSINGARSRTWTSGSPAPSGARDRIREPVDDSGRWTRLPTPWRPRSSTIRRMDGELESPTMCTAGLTVSLIQAQSATYSVNTAKKSSSRGPTG